MEGRVGDTIICESERVTQPARTGTIEEVVSSEPPRYRVRWQDGHVSIVTPAAGSARVERREPVAR